MAKSDDPRWMLDNLTTSILVLDHGLRLSFMNAAAEMMLALSFRQARGMAFTDLVKNADGALAAMRRCLEHGYHYSERELALTLAGERTITVDCAVTPLIARDQPDALLVELRQVDWQLRISRGEHRQAQHNVSRALIRNLAHEIKNPLGGLRGAAQLLEREFPDAVLKEYTHIIIGEVDRLRGLVDRMLGPISPPHYRALNIHEVLERVRGLVLAEADEVSIKQDYDPSIPLLIGDRDQLIQAVLNIMRNAVQALEGQGQIVLRTRVQRHCTIGQRRHKLAVRLDVIDDGPGIPEALQDEIFYPMISGRQQGTGLGLSIAQTLINQHGGSIEFTSRPGETVFTLLLPLERSDD